VERRRQRQMCIRDRGGMTGVNVGFNVQKRKKRIND
jgi:hypothetical protein